MYIHCERKEESGVEHSTKHVETTIFTDQRHVHQSNEDPEIQISPIFDDIEVSNAISKLKRNTQPSHFEFLLH